MSLLVPAIGQDRLLLYMVNRLAPDDVKYHLYSNNHTPAAADSLSNYTELAGGGYSAQTATGSGWSTAPVGGIETATAPDLTFSLTSSFTVYGYFVTDSGGTHLLWAELFTGGPITFASLGGTLTLTPTIGMS
jgi:hypothetical protein